MQERYSAEYLCSTFIASDYEEEKEQY